MVNPPIFFIIYAMANGFAREVSGLIGNERRLPPPAPKPRDLIGVFDLSP